MKRNRHQDHQTNPTENGMVPIHPLLLAEKFDTSGKSQMLPSLNVASSMANMRAAALAAQARARSEKNNLNYNPLLMSRLPDISRGNIHYDRNLPSQTGAKKQRKHSTALKFHPKGKFQAQADELRSKHEADLLSKEISGALLGFGIDTGIVNDILCAPSHAKPVESKDETIKLFDFPPDSLAEEFSFEWWDQPYDNHSSYQTNNLIQRPPPVRSSTSNRQNEALRLHLTHTERRKIRRQRRLAASKEKREAVKLGLEQAPPPKIRIANVARVLGATADPSRVEATIRQETEDRWKSHHQNNQQRKEEAKVLRKEKIGFDIASEEGKSIGRALFRIKLGPDGSQPLTPQQCFKVTKNAKQLSLTGVIVLHDGKSSQASTSNEDSDRFTANQFSDSEYKQLNSLRPPSAVILLEGLMVDIGRYSRLLMNRINWNNAELSTINSSDIHIDNSNDPVNVDWDAFVKNIKKSGSHNQEIHQSSFNSTDSSHTTTPCTVLWQSTIPNRKLPLSINTKRIYFEDDGSQIFRNLDLEQFWRLAVPL